MGYNLSAYEMGELEPSASMQLDTEGMQPHAREYLERDMTGNFIIRHVERCGHQTIDYTEGIQFSGKP